MPCVKFDRNVISDYEDIKWFFCGDDEEYWEFCTDWIEQFVTAVAVDS